MYNEWLELLQEAKDAGISLEDVKNMIHQLKGEE